MDKNKFWIYIIILAAAVVALFVFVYFSRALFDSADKTNTRDHIEELKTELSGRDLKLYWIGEPSKWFSGDNTVKVDPVDEKHLPLSYYREYIYSDVENADFQSVVIHDVEQECPADSVVIVSKSDLTDEQRKFLRRCSAESGSLILILGEDAVRSYRKYLFMSVDPTKEICSMVIFPDGDTKTNVIDTDLFSDTDSVSFQTAFYEYVTSYYSGH